MEKTDEATRLADGADDLVRRIEAVTSEIWSMKSLLYKQKDTKREERVVDYFLVESLSSLLEGAIEPLSKARKVLAVEAYDQRRKAAS